MLKVTLAYSPFYVQWDDAGKVNNPPTELFKQVVKYNVDNKDNHLQGAEANNETALLTFGATFKYNSQLCRIVSRSVEPMLICVNHCDDKEFRLNKDLVLELVVAYLA